MKSVNTLALLLLVGLIGSSCGSVSQLNTEYEEEMARVEKMSPEEKAEWERAQREKDRIDWDRHIGNGDAD